MTDTGRMCEVGTAKAVRTASLFYSIGCSGGGVSTAVSRRVLTSIVRPGMEYGMALVNLSKGQQVAVDKARYQILRKALSVPVAAGGSAILKVLGVPPTSFRASKLNACCMARVYDAGPDTLTAKILSFATKGWGSAERLGETEDLHQTSEDNIHWTRIKEAATPGNIAGRVAATNG